jgi:hypothetical protein
MSFRTQLQTKKFGNKCFRTLQGTMSHRPLTNTSSLKIAAAYPPYSLHQTADPLLASLNKNTGLLELLLLVRHGRDGKVPVHSLEALPPWPLLGLAPTAGDKERPVLKHVKFHYDIPLPPVTPMPPIIYRKLKNKRK